MPTSPTASPLHTTLIRPAHVAATDIPYDLGLRFDAHQPIPRGSILTIRAGNFRSVFQQWTYRGPLTTDRFQVLIKPEPTWEATTQQQPSFPGHDLILLRVQLTADLEPGDSLTLTVHGKQLWLAPLTMWLQACLSLDGGDEQPVGERFTFTHTPGPAARLECRVKPSPLDDGTHELTLFTTDRLFNPVTTYTGDFRLHPHPGIDNLPETVSPVDGVAHVRGLRVTSAQPIRLDAEAPADGLTCRSNYLLPEGFFPHQHLHGDIHFHTLFSRDGDRTLDQAYDYARDVLNLDFAAVTDHSPAADWTRTLDINDQHNRPGRFLTLHAWEWSTSKFGHVNFYLRSRDLDAGPELFDWYQHPASHDWPDGIIGVPHHTNIRATELNPEGKPCWNEYHWDRHHPCFRAVEINQTRGNFEADAVDDKWKIGTGDIGASARDALALGHRLGFTSGTDNHIAFPTRNALTDTAPGYIGLTGFLTPRRTRDDAWNALHHRHTYGTTGVPILCHFTVDHQPMGSAVNAKGRAALPAEIAFYATDTITDVELIAAGKTVQSFEVNAADTFRWAGDLPIPDGEHPYWYVRLRQADGHLAWTSPIFIDR